MEMRDAWAEDMEELRRRERVPAAQALAGLLAQAAPRWKGQVRSLTSMHDLLFAVPGDSYPFTDTVVVSWAEGLVDLTLRARRLVVSGERCQEVTAPDVLDAFVLQLVGGEAPDPAAAP